MSLIVQKWFDEDLDAPSAAPGAMSGTASMSFSNTAVMIGAGALVAAASITFSPSGSMTGAAPIAGTSTVTFTNTATLSGAGVLVGSSTPIFSLSGTLSEPLGPILGVISVSFQNSGILTGTSLVPEVVRAGGGKKKRKHLRPTQLFEDQRKQSQETSQEVIIHLPGPVSSLEAVLEAVKKAGFDIIEQEEEDDVLVLTFISKLLQ